MHDVVSVLVVLLLALLGAVCGWSVAAGQVLDCVEEVAEGPVGAGGVAGGVEVHEETAEDGENERCEIRPADAAQAVLERAEP
ncbi:hypothetical protein ABT314_20950, partial [Streptomyces spiralis]